MWTSNRRHVYLVCVIRLHPNGVLSNVLMQNQRHENRKTSGWSKSACSVNGRYRQLVPYVEDTNSDILFTIKGIEINFCRDVYGVRLYLPTRFEPGIARNTEVIADRTI